MQNYRSLKSNLYIKILSVILEATNHKVYLFPDRRSSLALLSGVLWSLDRLVSATPLL